MCALVFTALAIPAPTELSSTEIELVCAVIFSIGQYSLLLREEQQSCPQQQ